MAVGDVISGAAGTGTAADPYKPTTFLAWKTAVETNGSYVCMEQDIDVSKDSVYKTGLTDYLNVKCTKLYGMALTYDNTTTYNTGDKCTFNDGEHGLCTYTCLSDGVTGVDVTDTTYWTRGGDPTKKITGLIITSQFFMRLNTSPMTLCNLFFESCVFDCYGNAGNGFIYGDSSAMVLTFNDCKFSLFYNQHLGPWNLGCGNASPQFNRCSIYIRYSHGDINNMNYNKFVGGYNTQFNNCTVNLTGLGCIGDNGLNPCLGKPVNSSFIIHLDFRTASGSTAFTISTTSCFFAISFGEIVGDYAASIKPYQMSGVNIIDKDVAGNVPIITNANTIQGTTAQCKDKDWLISQGFFAS